MTFRFIPVPIVQSQFANRSLTDFIPLSSQVPTSYFIDLSDFIPHHFQSSFRFLPISSQINLSSGFTLNWFLTSIPVGSISSILYLPTRSFSRLIYTEFNAISLIMTYVMCVKSHLKINPYLEKHQNIHPFAWFSCNTPLHITILLIIPQAI